METDQLQSIYNQLIKGLQKYFKKAGYYRGVVGVSGGVDSSLTLKLAVDAFGPENVTAISMPELGVSSQENIDHAKALCHALNVKFFYQPLNQFLTDFQHLSWGPNKLATQNTKARIRAVMLYNYANTADALVLGTSNKSETLLGYGTKYGDLAADIEVIGDLYKDEVFALADHVGLPREIIDKPPTAELYQGQTDEGELGASYTQIDPILKKMKMGADKLIEHGMNPTLVHGVLSRIEKNKHKTEMPPIIKLKK